jgi:hypothetical protein
MLLMLILIYSFDCTSSSLLLDLVLEYHYAGSWLNEMGYFLRWFDGLDEKQLLLHVSLIWSMNHVLRSCVFQGMPLLVVT